MTKSEIRSAYLLKRKSMSEPDYLKFCQQITALFFTSFDLSFIRVIHVFLPIVSNREPDTWLIIDRIRREFPAVRLSLPRINKSANSIENFYFEGLHQLAEGPWGIKEPKQGVPTNSSDIDMVLVPLLAFDKLGHRIGYGKGYYDRFLKDCKSTCIKIGLSMLPPVQQIPSEDQDVPLDWCVTPDRVFDFREFKV